jgi:SAM-dependent methyltransferase
MDLWSTIKAVYIGEGIGRVLMNREVNRSVRLFGTVLDIGGRGNPSYRQHIVKLESHRLYVLDIIPDETVDAVSSVLCLPLASNSCDVILCFNVLEHVYDYSLALHEIKRVLKSGGTFYGRVPFLLGIHSDPSDYWRYTKETLTKILTEAGFEQISVDAQGGLFLVLFNLLGPIWKLGLIRIAFAACLILLNRLLSLVIGDIHNRERFPMGYFFVAR